MIKQLHANLVSLGFDGSYGPFLPSPAADMMGSRREQ
ncbi:hypothetical protein M2345_000497 [Sphingobium sp. B8D3D]|nr:hypothetical protein [Sphingobium sp. B8D3D]MCW2416972.1 hypothetical protein [Sphingobium sp. B8D3A]